MPAVRIELPPAATSLLPVQSLVLPSKFLRVLGIVYDPTPRITISVYVPIHASCRLCRSFVYSLSSLAYRCSVLALTMPSMHPSLFDQRAVSCSGHTDIAVPAQR